MTALQDAELRRIKDMLDLAGVPSSGRQVFNYPEAAMEIIAGSRSASRYPLKEAMPAVMSETEWEGLDS